MATQREVPGTEFVPPVITSADAFLIGAALSAYRLSQIRMRNKYAEGSSVRYALQADVQATDALIAKFGG